MSISISISISSSILVLSEQQACEHFGFQLSMSLHLSFELILSRPFSATFGFQAFRAPAELSGLEPCFQAAFQREFLEGHSVGLWRC